MLRRPWPSSGPGKSRRSAIVLLAVRLDAHAVEGAVEPAGRGQDRVADRLGLHAAGRIVLQQAVLRVGLLRGRRGPIRRLERLRQHQRADQPLHRPAVFHEAGGQVVEQLGVRRQLADVAEVVDRAHQAGAEQVVPDAVDHHPGGERVVGAGDPLGQLEPAAAPPTRSARRAAPAPRGSAGARARPAWCSRRGRTPAVRCRVRSRRRRGRRAGGTGPLRRSRYSRRQRFQARRQAGAVAEQAAPEQRRRASARRRRSPGLRPRPGRPTRAASA